MSDIADEMGGYMGDGSEIELPPQIKGKLEYHSTPKLKQSEIEHRFHKMIGRMIIENRDEDGNIGFLRQIELQKDIEALIDTACVEARIDELLMTDGRMFGSVAVKDPDSTNYKRYVELNEWAKALQNNITQPKHPPQQLKSGEKNA